MIGFVMPEYTAVECKIMELYALRLSIVQLHVLQLDMS